MESPAITTDSVWELLSGRLGSFIRSRVEDDATASDLLQETFLRIHQRIGDLAESDRLEPWVYQIARNLIVDHYRSRGSRVWLPVEDDTLTDTLTEPRRPAASLTPENANMLVASWLPIALEVLPEGYREAVRMYGSRACRSKKSPTASASRCPAQSHGSSVDAQSCARRSRLVADWSSTAAETCWIGRHGAGTRIAPARIAQQIPIPRHPFNKRRTMTATEKLQLNLTKNDLPENVRLEMISILQEALVAALDLRMQSKQAHWNVKGPSFIALHQLFDTAAAEAAVYSDDLAERLVQLGGVADGTVQTVAKSTAAGLLRRDSLRQGARRRLCGRAGGLRQDRTQGHRQGRHGRRQGHRRPVHRISRGVDRCSGSWKPTTSNT